MANLLGYDTDAPRLSNALRESLPAYAIHRCQKNGVLIHLVGGAHVLPSSARDAGLVTTEVGVKQQRLALVALELCPERQPMLRELLSSPGGYNGPPEPIKPLGTIFAENPMELLNPMFYVRLPMAAVEAIVRGRTGGEQAAAALVAKRLHTPVLLADQDFSVTSLRCLAMGMLALSPYASDYYKALRGPWSPEEQDSEKTVLDDDNCNEAEATTMEVIGDMQSLAGLVTEALDTSATATNDEMAVISEKAAVVLEKLVKTSNVGAQTIGSSTFSKMIGQPLLEERDAWLAQVCLHTAEQCPKNSAAVVILGAAHVNGVKKQLQRLEVLAPEDREVERMALSTPWHLRQYVLQNRLRAFDQIPDDIEGGLLDERTVVRRGAIGILGAAFLPMCMSVGVWKVCTTLDQRGNPTPLKWFKRFRFAGAALGTAALVTEVTLASRFVKNLRTLQERWHADVTPTDFR